MEFVPLWVMSRWSREDARRFRYCLTERVIFATRSGNVVVIGGPDMQFGGRIAMAADVINTHPALRLRILHHNHVAHLLRCASVGKEGWDALGNKEAYRSSWTWYYDDRDINDVILRYGKHCEVCGSSNLIDEPFDPRTYQRYPITVCSEECLGIHRNQVEAKCMAAYRHHERIKKERKWLKQGKTTLRNVRRYLRDLQESQTKASAPDTTSPTS